MEVYEGIERARNPGALRRRFEEILRDEPLLPVTPEVARRCALLRHDLRRQEKRVNQRALDLLIAATALEHDLTLVTRNTADYEDIAGLRLYSG